MVMHDLPDGMRADDDDGNGDDDDYHLEFQLAYRHPCHVRNHIHNLHRTPAVFGTAS